MKCRIKWLDHMSFVGESGSGHSVVMDSAPDTGGAQSRGTADGNAIARTGRLHRV